MNSLNPGEPILLVDDEEDIVRTVSKVLRFNGYTNVQSTTESSWVMDTLAEKGASLVLLDIMMPGKKGDELLEEITEQYPGLPVIMATANDSTELAVQCIKKGAYDYINKPLNTNRLLASIKGALEIWELRRENMALRNKENKQQPANDLFFKEIITQNSKMLSLFTYIETIAPCSQVALVSGETGVGKELFSRAIHRASGRKGKFVAVNVAGLDDDMFADTLFGHSKGAFTGASTRRPGLVEQAASGTLFLDEIGDLSKASQVKLLRLLQEKDYFPLGTDTTRKSDARIIVATNRNLEKMVNEEGYRQDLYYRLNSHQVAVPPLRERFDDLPLLVEHFVEFAGKELNIEPLEVVPQVYAYLSNLPFYGNIRELQSLILKAVSKQVGRQLGVSTLKSIVNVQQRSIHSEELKSATVSFGPVLPGMKEIKAQLAKEAMKRAGGSISLAAELVGTSRQGFGQFIKKHKIKA